MPSGGREGGGRLERGWGGGWTWAEELGALAFRSALMLPHYHWFKWEVLPSAGGDSPVVFAAAGPVPSNSTDRLPDSTVPPMSHSSCKTRGGWLTTCRRSSAAIGGCAARPPAASSRQLRGANLMLPASRHLHPPIPHPPPSRLLHPVPSTAVSIRRFAACQEYKPPPRTRTLLFLPLPSSSVAIAAVTLPSFYS